MAIGDTATRTQEPMAPAGRTTPFRLVLRVAVIIFAVAVLTALYQPALTPLFDAAGIRSEWAQAVLSALLLVGIASPIVYFSVFRPYVLARERAKVILGQNEATLFKAQRLAKIGNWRWSVASNELISCSEEYARIHGVGLDEIHELMRDHGERVVHPEDRDRIAAAFARADAEGGDYEIEYRILLPDGAVRHVLEIGEAVADASGRVAEHVGTIQDITDRKRVEGALHDSQSLYQGLIQVAPVSIFVQTPAEGRIVFVNDRGVELLGAADRDEILGRSLVEFLHPDYREQARERNRRILAGEPVDPVVEGKMIRIDGTPIDVERSVSGCSYHGEPALQSILHDVTERKASELAIIAAQEEAVLANRAKSEFLANMSHELRTPLNAIIGFADLIGSECFGPVGDLKYKDYAGDISDSGQHLLELINDILDLSKIESGRMEIQEDNVDAADTIRSCLRLMAERARQSKLDLSAEIDEAMDCLLRVDSRMFKQILVNLISNAVKFTPSGGRVTVKAWQNPHSGFVIQIEDNGIGMALVDIPKALARFGQIDSTLARKHEGTGLGLPLTKSLVELHGGSFDLQSTVGQGTIVTVRFPAQRLVARVDQRRRSPAA